MMIIKKLYEEYQEVIDASGSDRLEELADMLEVIRILSKLENIDLNDIIKIAAEKIIKRGSFNDGIFIKKVIESE